MTSGAIASTYDELPGPSTATAPRAARQDLHRRSGSFGVALIRTGCSENCRSPVDTCSAFISSIACSKMVSTGRRTALLDVGEHAG